MSIFCATPASSVLLLVMELISAVPRAQDETNERTGVRETMYGICWYVPEDLCAFRLTGCLDWCPTKPRDAGKSENGFEMVGEPVTGIRIRGVPRPKLFRPAFDDRLVGRYLSFGIYRRNARRFVVLFPGPIVDPGVAGDFGGNTRSADDLEDAVCFGTHVYLFDIGEEVLEVLLVFLRWAKCVYVDFGNDCGRVLRGES